MDTFHQPHLQTFVFVKKKYSWKLNQPENASNELLIFAASTVRPHLEKKKYCVACCF